MSLTVFYPKIWPHDIINSLPTIKVIRNVKLNIREIKNAPSPTFLFKIIAL
jgi:hypothetical protein